MADLASQCHKRLTIAKVVKSSEEKRKKIEIEGKNDS